MLKTALYATALAMALVPAAALAADDVPLGHPDFYPSDERPVRLAGAK